MQVQRATSSIQEQQDLAEKLRKEMREAANDSQQKVALSHPAKKFAQSLIISLAEAVHDLIVSQSMSHSQR